MKSNKNRSIILAVLWTIVLILSAVKCFLGTPIGYVVTIGALFTLVLRCWIDVFDVDVGEVER